MLAMIAQKNAGAHQPPLIKRRLPARVIFRLFRLFRTRCAESTITAGLVARPTLPAVLDPLADLRSWDRSTYLM